MGTHWKFTAMLLASLFLPILAQGQVKKTEPSKKASKPSIEEKTKIHRLKSNRRAVFDAFAYLNRIPLKAESGESPDDVAGRIFSRLANQEGRILVKIPTGMDMGAYQGFKTFFRYEGKKSVGNCGACHTLPDFTDLKSHFGPGTVEKKPTLSLRTSQLTENELRMLINKKIQFAKTINDDSKATSAYAKIVLGEKDVANVVHFLGLLKDVPSADFRKLILEAKVLDTSGLLND